MDLTSLGFRKPLQTEAYSVDDSNFNADKANELILVDREQINNLVADYIRSPGYGVTTGSANIYVLTLNPALAAYTAGVCVAVKINVANTGASTININGLGAKPIKDSKGNALASGKLALNSVYTFRYDGTNFILQGEGGEYGTATASDVLLGKTIGTDNGLIEGTIPSKGIETIIPGTVAKTIASGQYLTGNQVIEGDSDLISANIKAGINIFGVAGNSNVVDTSAGDAVAVEILSPKKAYVDGALVTGAMINRGAVTITPGATSKAIDAGYHNGLGVVSAVSNLTSANIKSGVTVGGVLGSFKTGIKQLVHIDLDAIDSGLVTTTFILPTACVLKNSFILLIPKRDFNTQLISATLTNTTTITFNKYSTSYYWSYLEAYFIEFDEGVIKSKQLITVPYSTNGYSDITISAVDPAKTLVLASSFYESGSNGDLYSQGSGYALNATTIRSTPIGFSSYYSGVSQVIEFY